MREPIKTYVTNHECSDGDFATQLAKGYPNIPAGRNVHFIKLWANFYGVWAKVTWQGRVYDIEPENLTVKVRDIIQLDGPKPGCFAFRKKEDIVLTGQIPLWDENLKPISSYCWLAVNSVGELIQVRESECEYFYLIDEEREEKIKYGPYDIQLMQKGEL